MADQVFKYRGKTLEELKQLDVAEFSKLLDSRKRRTMSRDVLKRAEPLMKKVRDTNEGKRKKKIKTHIRTLPVLPEMVGLTIGIYNGKEFNEIVIVEEMLGLFLGELAPTRKKLSHGSAGVGATKSSTSASSKAK